MVSAIPEKGQEHCNRAMVGAKSAWGIKKGFPEKMTSELDHEGWDFYGPFQHLKKHLESFLLNNERY